jgi:hypothetical protein
MALFDKLKNLFRRKEVARPLSTKGHRGHAFRSLADPDLSAENQTKWKKLGGESVLRRGTGGGSGDRDEGGAERIPENSY